MDEPKTTPIADALSTAGKPEGAVTVALSNELVRLLSEQLYQSPLKAIEELVVNAYDAEARECRIFVPTSADHPRCVIVFDDGAGMDAAGLTDLWHIGRSNKRSEEVERRAKRTQIGKFGIGKLATYAIAMRVTYLSKRDGALGVTLDFRRFADAPGGAGLPVELPIRAGVKLDDLLQVPAFANACATAGIDTGSLSARKSWTFAILEEMKPKWDAVNDARLRWVLSTAMPFASDFSLFLNSAPIQSFKSQAEVHVQFDVGELPANRIEAIDSTTGEKWKVKDGGLYSASFPKGIKGRTIVTATSLHAGKSADIGRSHGFFVRVRNRLVNEDDPLFGLSPLSYQTFNRFRSDLTIDDLDASVTAPREGVGVSPLSEKAEAVLGEIFYEARERYEAVLKPGDEDARAKEHERNYVSPRLVERPLADVLSSDANGFAGGEADDSWFYLDVPKGTDFKALIADLYNKPRSPYRYSYSNRGPNERLVRFDPKASTFVINADHDLVRAHADGKTRWLLEDIVTAEALLEVYLREHEISPSTIGEILERRDSLLRSLASDHLFSLAALGSAVRDARNNERDLEVAVVAAARALGFVAKHISGSGEPDGLARFRTYQIGDAKITLEAKASATVPTLAQLDFAGLEEHARKYEAAGCLLVAPSFPGPSKGNDSSAADRAREGRISCWTTELLAKVVEQAEARQITARQVMDIVMSTYAPDDVRAKVEALLSEPKMAPRELYRAVIAALRQLENRLPGKVRTVDMVATEVSGDVPLAVERR